GVALAVIDLARRRARHVDQLPARLLGRRFLRLAEHHLDGRDLAGLLARQDDARAVVRALERERLLRDPRLVLALALLPVVAGNGLELALELLDQRVHLAVALLESVRERRLLALHVLGLDALGVRLLELACDLEPMAEARDGRRVGAQPAHRRGLL